MPCIASNIDTIPRYPTATNFYLFGSKDLYTYLALHLNGINKGALMQARLFFFISNIYFAKKRIKQAIIVFPRKSVAKNGFFQDKKNFKASLFRI